MSMRTLRSAAVRSRALCGLARAEVLECQLPKILQHDQLLAPCRALPRAAASHVFIRGFAATPVCEDPGVFVVQPPTDKFPSPALHR